MNVNSTGLSTTLTGSWITGAGIGGGMSDLHLECTNGVPSELGYFLVSAGFSDPGLAISNGQLCVGDGANAFLRYNVIGTSSSSVGLFDAAGVLVNAVSTSTSGTGFDVPDTVAGSPAVITYGSTWHFQVWHRDTPASSGASNFSNGLSVTFPVGPSVPIAGMVSIPAGSFSMGSDAAAGAPYWGDTSTQPVHDVTITQDFWMGEHEVTQAEYQALMGVNPSFHSGPNLPVEQVSWHDARAYCTALTAQEIALGNLAAGHEYRLPTEAEWEYACRAGTTTEFNVGVDLFCTDAQFGYSNHSNSSCSSSSPVDVGGYPANAFGLHDMDGNVTEWCLDSYTSYSSGAVTAPFVTGVGSSRVLRGGSWYFNSNFCRSANRLGVSPGSSHSGFGFRVVLAQVLVVQSVPIAGMVSIPAGSFFMGSDAAAGAPFYGDSSTQPVHDVTITQDFWMKEHEVTQADYQALMGVNPSSFSGPNLPVEQVSWDDASAYCTALTAQEMALGNVAAGHEYRLPTEAEWEYACRAGTTSEFNLGAELFCADANFSYSDFSTSSCSSSSPVDVGGYPANAFGLHDMHGNVWEWCLDSWASYSSGAVTNPFVTGTSFSRVVRGGNWIVASYACQSAFRFDLSPGFSSNYIGFRVVLAPVLVP
jgi:formylglycine-generating enzyme required for sulfatase activity